MLALVVGCLAFASFAIAAPIPDPRQQADQAQHFDFMILALSWSPTYCSSSEKRDASNECKNPANRGFVVHGLWPQAVDGARLRCPANKGEFSKALFERAVEIFPDLKLAQSQWQRHGQCFGFAADTYVERTALARSKLVIPETFRAPDQPISIAPDDVRARFNAANSTLPKDAISVSCRNGDLVEVLVCLKSDLSVFTPCPQVSKRSCRAETVQMPVTGRP